MGWSFGGEVIARNKAMWVCPKMIFGANPSERWGHSACYFNGEVYIFGGCRGGVHFSDVLMCNLATMTWNILKTSGPGPGPRDSHSAVLVGHRMLVFGGTNGSKKVNDLHILDLLSREWTHPQCCGNPPCARESHTANVVCGEKLVIFGGSGEGEANYLNDLHILDLKNMEWSSPEVRGSLPAPRDSHSSVAVGNRLFVFGGDSGDRYQRDVSVLDMNKLIWSKLGAHGPSPGARAGHAAVSMGTKVYVLGGVGDKQYYSDIWVLDVITSSWLQLDINTRKSQGRFSHTATVTNLGIAVFGGCGEDERPLSELLFLQIDSSTSRAFVGLCEEEETEVLLQKAEDNLRKTIFVGDKEDLTSQEVEELKCVPKQSLRFSSDMLHPKRQRTSNSKLPEKNPELEEHFHSRSEQSSLSQSDHEETPVKKNIRSCCSCLSSRVHHPLLRTCQDACLTSEHPNQIKQEHRNIICTSGCPLQCNATESLSLQGGKMTNLIGAEVHGQVDGAFDSGYLMTTTVNGKVFRGILFAPGHDLIVPRGTILGQHPVSLVNNHANSGQNQLIVGYPRHGSRQLLAPAPRSHQYRSPEQIPQSRRSTIDSQGTLPLGKDSRANGELQGVVLTLASPGSDHPTRL